MIKLLKMAPFLLLAGCAAVGPDWEVPTTPLPATFTDGNVAHIDDVAYRAWWRDFNDPLLTKLVERGFEQNLSILQAKERINEANAKLRGKGINSALSGSASFERLRSGTEGQGSTISSESSLGASFVIDLFGGIRREREAAVANLAAIQSNVGTERLAWLAELVADYSNARYYQQALELTRDTIATRKETLDITKKEVAAGASTQYELAQAEAALQAAQAELPSYQAQFKATVFAIATLLDEPAGPLMAEMQQTSQKLVMPTGINIGVPADLLRNRPDVRYYEAILHQQVATVGVDESSLYPSISLNGTVSNTDSVNGWSFGPSISLGIFNRGALHAQRDAQVSVAKQAEIDWRASVIGAVEDVQVAQSNFTLYQEQTELLNKAAASYGRALALGRNNYRNGAMTLLDLLDTVRSEASAQINAASVHNSAIKEWASLQIAIGAGAGFSDKKDEEKDVVTSNAIEVKQ
ncbi:MULTISPECIES: efflux transporter outer membrane subunit [Marinomonas]|uniref:Efflux transporter outer membrane subunit n=1 Tax=Marinomonas rhodophyticola TaxID=2992803 RepID=A0ABT3KB39_9GAMM|nr:efflux transporter outer membrane subunit [Marinomonas sp. KJ51-3]MCW4627750.1 efflux transporter outer membrane subunit [Marinomonas sp. KJ51-3]